MRKWRRTQVVFKCSKNGASCRNLERMPSEHCIQVRRFQQFTSMIQSAVASREPVLLPNKFILLELVSLVCGISFERSTCAAVHGILQDGSPHHIRERAVGECVRGTRMRERCTGISFYARAPMNNNCVCVSAQVSLAVAASLPMHSVYSRSLVPGAAAVGGRAHRLAAQPMAAAPAASGERTRTRR